MARLGRLVVELSANTARFTRGIESVDRRLARFGQSAQRVTRLAQAAFGLLTVGKLGQEIISINDRYAQMEGRLKLVQRAGENLAITQERLFQVAQRSRNQVGATVDFYTQLSRATKNLNINQNTLLTTTEAINQAITISGASSASAGAALFQLQQGLAAGALRGQELNSVLEQTPRVAEAIADGLGITIGQLRKYGEEGRLTAETVITAINSQAATLKKEFSTVPVTVAQNFQLLRNEIEKATSGFGLLNRIVSSGVEGLTSWVTLYNDISNNQPAEERLQELTTELFHLNRELKGGIGVSESYEMAVRNRITAVKAEIKTLNDQVFAHNKAAEAQRSAGESLAAQAKAQESRLKGLMRQEELMRNNLSTQERMNNRVLELNSLWQGNIISLEAYREKIRETLGISQELGKTTLDPGFASAGATEGFTERLAANHEFLQEHLRQSREAGFAEVQDNQQKLDRIRRDEEAHRQFMLSGTASLFGSLASIVGQGSKKQFELSKKLARAQTIISTYSAAQKAYESQFIPGDPSSFARATLAASVAVSAGLARLAAINRTSFSSSSSAAANSGSGSFVPAPTPGPITPGDGRGNPAQAQQIIFIVGSGSSSFTDEQIQEILEKTSREINQGSRIIIDRYSRQATEIVEAVAAFDGGSGTQRFVKV